LSLYTLLFSPQNFEFIYVFRLIQLGVFVGTHKYLNKFYLKHNGILIPKFTKQFYLALRLKNKKFPEGPLAGVKFIEEITLY